MKIRPEKSYRILLNNFSLTDLELQPIKSNNCRMFDAMENRMDETHPNLVRKEENKSSLFTGNRLSGRDALIRGPASENSYETV